MIGHFGHCTQELINLLLVGQATSNIFDGSVPLGGGEGGGGGSNVDTSQSSGDSLMLRGVPGRSTIGYLSQLEALRYCQVDNDEMIRQGCDYYIYIYIFITGWKLL